MSEEKIYQFNEYVLGYDKGENDRSALTISKVQNGNIYVIGELFDGSADVISMILDNLNKELQQKENIIKEVRELNYKIQEDYSHQALFNNDFASGMYKASEMNIEILEKRRNKWEKKNCRDTSI